MTLRVSIGILPRAGRRGGGSRGATEDRDMDESEQLYFDDFALGDRFKSPGRTIGEAHFVLFAGLTGDNHPIHYDEEYARQTRFGGRVAHGLLVMAMTVLGGSPLSPRLERAMIAFAEQGCRFLRPVLVNDTVRAEFEVTELTRKGDRGLLRFGVRVLNQRGEVVLEGHHLYLVKCR
jgi:3-hydroxybutyryl-CoA dehydratase